LSARSPYDFKRALEGSSERTRSKIVLALDLDYHEDNQKLLKEADRIIKDTSSYVCAFKINLHLIIPLSLSELALIADKIKEAELVSIVDLKLNDISNTNLVACKYLWKAGFSAVIVNPFAGYEGSLDSVFSIARSEGKGVICLGYMSHKGADEGYGLSLADGRKVYELLVDRAKVWGADGVVVGATRPEIISFVRERLHQSGIKIFSPGVGAQGGSLIESLKAGSDYLIFGRSIVNSPNPNETVKTIWQSLQSV
jgi:orotidine-5'-phosphate decarboxylase